jgi:hypothetical protein
MKLSIRLWSLILIFFALVFGLWGVNDPFVGGYSANNNYLMLAAKNYIRFGLVPLHFLPTYFAGATLPQMPPYYLHHPVLMFLLAIPPFVIFGFDNWVVHVVPFLFVISSLIFFYYIVEEVWDKDTAWLAVGCASIFPVLGFFWKYIFFEQVSMCFQMMNIYFLLRYQTTKNHRYFLWFIVSAFLGICSDWGGAYLLFAYATLLLSGLKKNLVRPFVAYFLVIVLGFLIFIYGSMVYGEGLKAYISHTVMERVAGNGLFSQHFVWLTYVGILLSRVGIYFSPFAFVWLIIGIKNLRLPWHIQSKQHMVLFVFMGLGSVNILFLPNVTWGYAYFLYYCIPFVALSGALFFQKIVSHKRIIALIMFLLIVWSGIVNFQKLSAVRKQQWKYKAALHALADVSPYTPVMVYHFPGDVLENYFFHPTVEIGPDYKQDITHMPIVASCWDICSPDENAYLATITTLPNGIVLRPPAKRNEIGWIYFYRRVRDMFHVGQL